jgi:hypothetical protein
MSPLNGTWANLHPENRDLAQFVEMEPIVYNWRPCEVLLDDPTPNNLSNPSIQTYNVSNHWVLLRTSRYLLTTDSGIEMILIVWLRDDLKKPAMLHIYDEFSSQIKMMAILVFVLSILQLCSYFFLPIESEKISTFPPWEKSNQLIFHEFWAVVPSSGRKN